MYERGTPRHQGRAPVDGRDGVVSSNSHHGFRARRSQCRSTCRKFRIHGTVLGIEQQPVVAAVREGARDVGLCALRTGPVGRSGAQTAS